MEQDRSGRDRSARPWWQVPGGISLCAAMPVGKPMDVHLFGAHLADDLAPAVVALGLFAAVAVWMFRRWGGEVAAPTTAPTVMDSDALWAELTAAADGSVEEDEPAEREQVTL